MVLLDLEEEYKYPAVSSSRLLCNSVLDTHHNKSTRTSCSRSQKQNQAQHILFESARRRGIRKSILVRLPNFQIIVSVHLMQPSQASDKNRYRYACVRFERVRHMISLRANFSSQQSMLCSNGALERRGDKVCWRRSSGVEAEEHIVLETNGGQHMPSLDFRSWDSSTFCLSPAGLCTLGLFYATSKREK